MSKNYVEVTPEKLDSLFRDWEIDHQQSERGQFLAYNSQLKVRIVADNRTHDFFMEEFKTKEEALEWLNEY